MNMDLKISSRMRLRMVGAVLHKVRVALVRKSIPILCGFSDRSVMAYRLSIGDNSFQSPAGCQNGGNVEALLLSV